MNSTNEKVILMKNYVKELRNEARHDYEQIKSFMENKTLLTTGILDSKGNPGYLLIRNNDGPIKKLGGRRWKKSQLKKLEK